MASVLGVVAVTMESSGNQSPDQSRPSLNRPAATGLATVYAAMATTPLGAPSAKALYLPGARARCRHRYKDGLQSHHPCTHPDFLGQGLQKAATNIRTSPTTSQILMSSPARTPQSVGFQKVGTPGA